VSPNRKEERGRTGSGSETTFLVAKKDRREECGRTRGYGENGTPHEGRSFFRAIDFQANQGSLFNFFEKVVLSLFFAFFLGFFFFFFEMFG
jgi:hypothetical protein